MDEEFAKTKVEALQRVKKLLGSKAWGIGARVFNESSYAKTYGAKQLPTVGLLDREGNVIDTDARGERLEPLIRECLGLKTK